MKGTTIIGRKIEILGYLTLIHKSSYREKYFIVATSPTIAQNKPRLYFTSEVNGMTQKKAAKLSPYVGSIDNLSMPTDIAEQYI